MHPAASKALFDEDVKNLTPALCKRRGWVMHEINYPVVDCSLTAQGRTPLRLKLICDNWNDLPPAVRLDAADGTPLRALLPNSTGIFNPGPHHLTNLPFVCMRGAREYHTHPSHVNDFWEPLKDKSSYTIGGILTQLWHAWLKGAG